MHVEERHPEIVANRYFVSSQTISMNGERLCASLNTLELSQSANRRSSEARHGSHPYIEEDMVRDTNRGQMRRSTTVFDIFLDSSDGVD
jgi:hypothetical protein